ncbi:F0F1 ATP synthase subunit delta [Benzoatithermus flavus]|uniref:ATP synthase subunit delta n=1 Tax=Benzoatithermus flavus TaxID=3108223 RepID=A0ABU8XLE7_9PROT
MPASTAMASGVAGRYATALFELASERSALEQVERDLAALDRAIAESADLKRLISSPIVSREDQARAMEALSDQLGLGRIVKNFLGVIAERRRLAALPAMIAAFNRLLAQHRGEETAEVTSAVPLDEAQLASIKDAVAAYAGRPVQLTTSVDPGLLGGLVVRIGSRMIDASLKTKLQHLELSMRGVR